MELMNQSQGPETVEAPQADTQAPTVTDIDSLSEFTFQGEKFTPERFQKLYRDASALSETQKEYQSTKQYVENLEIDLEKVLQDPSLADAFKKVYPKQFHTVLDRLLGSRPDAPQAQATNSSLPKEFQDKFSSMERKINEYERKTYEAEVSKQEAYLQRVVDPLFSKFPYANSDAVYAKAEALIAQGYRMTDSSWERLVKENHLAIEKKAEANHQMKLKAQIEKGQKAKDTGPGGAAPGQAPARARTFAEATEEMIRSLKKAP